MVRNSDLPFALPEQSAQTVRLLLGKKNMWVTQDGSVHVSNAQVLTIPTSSAMIYSYVPGSLPVDQGSVEVFLPDSDRPLQPGREPRGRIFNVSVGYL